MNDLLKKYFIDVNDENSIAHKYNQIGLFSFMLFAMIYSFLVKASYYGRHIGDRKFFMISGRASWILQECPTVFVTLYFLITTKYEILSINFLGSLLFLIHYIHRTFIYPIFGISSPNEVEKKYPAELTILAFLFCLSNAYIQNNSILIYSIYPFEYTRNLFFIFGIFLFFLGMYINIYHDYLMINQRKKALETKKVSYVIPIGFLFEYITCPNYLGEIIEWIGFYIAFQTLSGFIFAFSTFANLFPRALANHKWNIEKFKDKYPLERKAIIPYVI